MQEFRSSMKAKQDAYNDLLEELTDELGSVIVDSEDRLGDDMPDRRPSIVDVAAARRAWGT